MLFPKDGPTAFLRHYRLDLSWGVHYVAAIGNRIPDDGEQRIPCWYTEGIGNAWAFQVCKANKPLVSVAKLTEGGGRVVSMRPDPLRCTQKSGKSVKLHTERCVSVVQAFLESDSKTSKALSAALAAVARPANEQVFTRQAP